MASDPDFTPVSVGGEEFEKAGSGRFAGIGDDWRDGQGELPGLGPTNQTRSSELAPGFPV